MGYLATCRRQHLLNCVYFLVRACSVSRWRFLPRPSDLLYPVTGSNLASPDELNELLRPTGLDRHRYLMLMAQQRERLSHSRLKLHPDEAFGAIFRSDCSLIVLSISGYVLFSLLSSSLNRFPSTSLTFPWQVRRSPIRHSSHPQVGLDQGGRETSILIILPEIPPANFQPLRIFLNLFMRNPIFLPARLKFHLPRLRRR